MKDIRKTKTQLINELVSLRKKLEEGGQTASIENTPNIDLLRRVADGMLEPTVIIDWEGNLLHGNTFAAGVIGVSGPSDLVGMNIGEFVHPDSVEQAAVDLEQVKNSEADFSAKYKLLIDGKTIHIESHGTKIELDDGSVDLVSFRDVTEKSEADEELKRQAERFQSVTKSEKMFRGLTESMNAMVMIVNVENERVVYANPAATEMTGYSVEELTAFPAPNLFTEETERQAMVYREAWARGEEVPTRMELEIVTKDNQSLWVETSVALIDLEEGGLHKVATSFDITARKRAEMAMRESEKQFRALADSTTASIAIVGCSGNEFTYANQTMLDRAGMAWEEFSTLDPSKSLSQVALDAGTEAAEEAEKNGVDQYRFEYKEEDGNWREVNVARIQIDGEDATIYTSFDITAHKTAQKALEDSEAKFRNLAESTTAHITILQDDKYIYANQAFLDYMGVENDELSLITVEELMMGTMGPDTAERAMPAWEAAMASGDNKFNFEFPDLEGNWFQTNVSIMEIGGKESYLSMTFDINELKRAQEELASSEKRYRTIFDTAGTGMISFGKDGVITLANEEWTNLSGYSMEETVGELTWMRFFTDASLAKMKRYHEMRSKDPESVPNAYEAEFMDRKGKIHDGIVNIQVVPGTQQRVASFQDMTQLKQAQHEMYRADKMAALGQIIAGVAHEINNPNNFIFFNLPILKKYIEAIRPMLDHHVEDDPNLKILNMSYEAFLEDIFKLIENMEHGSRRITGIVSELKTYVRSDEDNQTRSECVTSVIERVMALVGKQVRKTVKRFEVNLDKDLPSIKMNPGKIEQVLINLVINAGQAANKDDSYVELSARRGELNSGPCVEIEVSDNGAGIPGELRDQVFEPFFTSKGRDAGTGLGLSISQRIIEEHGGTIEFESEVGEGTKFTIRLPAA